MEVDSQDYSSNMTPIDAVASPPGKQRRSKIKKQLNIFAIARQKLQLSALPEYLPGRETERQEIMDIIERCLKNPGQGACLCIQKLSSVHEILKTVHTYQESQELPPFQFVEINAMKLTDPQHAYSYLLKKLTQNSKRATAAHAAQILDKKFQGRKVANKNQRTIILLVDELDILVTRKQTVLYNFFEWPTRENVPLVVIGISNTMNLPEQMKAKVYSRLGLSRIVFKPYTKEQLETIIQTRLAGLAAFDGEAVNLIASKIANVSGDARRALELCRRACLIAEGELQRQESKEEEIMDSSLLVKVSHVQKSLDDMFYSGRTQAIRSLALHERLFLCSVALQLRVTGLGETTLEKSAERHLQLCRSHDIKPIPSCASLIAICQRLGSFKLLIVEPGHFDLNQRIILNVSADDLTWTLREDGKLKSILDSNNLEESSSI